MVPRRVLTTRASVSNPIRRARGAPQHQFRVQIHGQTQCIDSKGSPCQGKRLLGAGVRKLSENGVQCGPNTPNEQEGTGEDFVSQDPGLLLFRTNRRREPMQQMPIFDTSALINLCRNDDSLDAIAKRLKPLIPARGCPLSFITVLELFHGLYNCDANRMDETLRPLHLAARLSRRKVLSTPITFTGRELFQVADRRGGRRSILPEWLAIVQRPDFASRFASGDLKDEINLEKIEKLFVQIREKHPVAIVQMLDRMHPSWREDRKTGSALPEDKREEFKRKMPFEKWKAMLPEQLITEMGAEKSPTNLDRARTHCDAYFTFTINLLRDSIVSNYNFEDNPNDFHDGLQLLYLTRPLYRVVTDDKPSRTRVSRSSQVSRVMSLDEFLSRAA